jgi:hypothetical protein
MTTVAKTAVGQCVMLHIEDVMINLYQQVEVQHAVSWWWLGGQDSDMCHVVILVACCNRTAHGLWEPPCFKSGCHAGSSHLSRLKTAGDCVDL